MDLQLTLQNKFNPIFEVKLIEEMAQNASLVKVKAGEILIDINQTIAVMPIVLEGAIKILREDEDGNELFLYYIESGSTCAASITCCMNDQKSNILAIVEEDVTFLSVPIAYMDEWMVKYSSWRKFILSSYAMRYDELLEIVDVLAFKKMDGRILNYLSETVKLNKTSTVEISHQALAYNLNTSREVVSRILKQLEKKGMVKLSRGAIQLMES
ncbi:Crp/Fnr family transcriptional regulator [Crocinitomix catalasitica]|uniref:Crp/Fnr family transcriptional regulator n=1 Tax=Crocinitomix catalasitica TaxID=184607 RepID=UPI000686AC22|nr:Crp/Fnr family transcriptional regulator [Crocinitomix catalasitica]